MAVRALPDKPLAHVEVQLTPECRLENSGVQNAVSAYLREYARRPFAPGRTRFDACDFVAHPESGFLRANFAAVTVEHSGRSPLASLDDAEVLYHIFLLADKSTASSTELLTADGDDEDGESDAVACRTWALPCAEWESLWDSLVYDDDIKDKLLEYVKTTMLFSDHGVNPNLISWNRVVLLHGPPGTGKTSLCKALAQKLAIRLSHKYDYGKLIEINSHSLFSKWFSESGKLVMKMFAGIRAILEDESAFVCVLIDEVESLASARKAALSGSEPSDSIRVVNALLTQIDQIKTHKNVLILTTSNITDAIDLAFVDRADIKQFIRHPSHGARYAILKSCIDELVRVGLVAPMAIPAYSEIDVLCAGKAVRVILEIARECEGMSGRALRKAPFLAFARLGVCGAADFYEFLGALLRHARAERQARMRDAVVSEGEDVEMEQSQA